MITNKFEDLWANVYYAKKDLERTPMNDILKYMRGHEQVTVKELGEALYGKDYYDRFGYTNMSYNARIAAVLKKLVHAGYAKYTVIETEGKPIEIECTMEEKVFLYDEEDFYTYLCNGWHVYSAHYYDDNHKMAIGLATRKVEGKKLIKPTIKKYQLVVKE